MVNLPPLLKTAYVLCGNKKLDRRTNSHSGALMAAWLLVGKCKTVWEDEYTCMWVGKTENAFCETVCVSEREKEREFVWRVGFWSSAIGYPDKAIREKQILQPHRFNSVVLHPDELLKNGVQLKLVLYERLHICLLSGLLPPVFIGCKGLLINLPLLLSDRRGWAEESAAFPPQHWGGQVYYFKKLHI